MKNKLAIFWGWISNFFLTPASVLPITFLRISFGIYNLVLLSSLYPYLHDLYGPNGYIEWVYTDNFFVDHALPSIQYLFESLPSFIHVSPDEFITILFVIQVISFVAITFGFFSNGFAVVAWLLHLTFSNTGMIYAYGVESITHVVLFYFIFMPLDAKFSLTNVLKKRIAASRNMHVHARLFMRVLQIHLCIIYVSAGIAKMAGSHWWNGEAVWRSFTQFPFNNFKPTIINSFPTLLTLAGWLVVAAETLYCFFIWYKPTRRYMLGIILLMHFMIGVIMGLHFFAAVMIIVNLGAFAFNMETKEYEVEAKGLIMKQRRPAEPSTS